MVAARLDMDAVAASSSSRRCNVTDEDGGSHSERNHRGIMAQGSKRKTGEEARIMTFGQAIELYGFNEAVKLLGKKVKK